MMCITRWQKACYIYVFQNEASPNRTRLRPMVQRFEPLVQRLEALVQRFEPWSRILTHSLKFGTIWTAYQRFGADVEVLDSVSVIALCIKVLDRVAKLSSSVGSCPKGSRYMSEKPKRNDKAVSVHR
jgi:hypothetical protein